MAGNLGTAFILQFVPTEYLLYLDLYFNLFWRALLTISHHGQSCGLLPNSDINKSNAVSILRCLYASSELNELSTNTISTHVFEDTLYLIVDATSIEKKNIGYKTNAYHSAIRNRS